MFVVVIFKVLKHPNLICDILVIIDTFDVFCFLKWTDWLYVSFFALVWVYWRFVRHHQSLRCKKKRRIGEAIKRHFETKTQQWRTNKLISAWRWKFASIDTVNKFSLSAKERRGVRTSIVHSLPSSCSSKKKGENVKNNFFFKYLINS